MSDEIEIGTVLVRLSQEEVEANGGEWYFRETEPNEVTVTSVATLWGGNTVITVSDGDRFTVEPDDIGLSYKTFFKVKE